MIRSMTAYARREIKGEWGSATWEMRSVNQRYLETYFRLPEQFRSLEPVVRETEGQALKALIEQRLEGVSAEVAKVRAHMPEILQWQRERLVAKLEDAQVQLENNRLEQELVMMAQRIDVAEELDRLEAHIKETYNILKKKEAVGRRLDFMMQEFNRESNTLASKSINADVTNSAIELKVLIEQMREQIQNIE
ncbi:YicC family protein [Salmonella enterica]|nr:YicC family protein [Salmonella enterica]EHA5894377.1 YicC family protein [Salmonella enterica subsp. enterica serovar Dublin]EEO7505696.1 YicC family protein [Salmonella enterica]EEO7509873.1 YicC family protein [Salmonella enterica]EHA5896527.1 YicC family protein [Salmonella enterica subsp. enterica serovar Dublin]